MIIMVSEHKKIIKINIFKKVSLKGKINMLTYSFADIGSDSLYEHLYKCIKNDIKKGVLEKNEKLPSKRSLAKNLGISVITVENAYAQLIAEGYVYSIAKKGYYVSDIRSGYIWESGVRGNQRGKNISGVADRTSDIWETESFKNLYAEKSHEKNSDVVYAGVIGEDSKNDSSSLLKNTSIKNGVEQINLVKERMCDRIDEEFAVSDVQTEGKYIADFTKNRMISDMFPFTIWTKLIRQVLSEQQNALMTNPPSGGAMELRRAIAKHLKEFRGMIVAPEQIIVGAGTEYLYGLIIQLLGMDKKYGVEDPGYDKISKIYRCHGVEQDYIGMDEYGVIPSQISEKNIDILHITPSHHFPTGIVMPISRRYELLGWANQDEERYIIEDDYDSELRLNGQPIPALQSIDVSEKVIYINTFTKTLSSTVRISYMVLPEKLLEKFYKTLFFYSCTVSNFEQYTLAKFIDEGCFEKHINRMRKYYSDKRKKLFSVIKKSKLNKYVTVHEEDAGLQFLMEIKTKYSDEELVRKAAKEGIKMSPLSGFYHLKENRPEHIFVMNYLGVEESNIEKTVEKLCKIIAV